MKKSLVILALLAACAPAIAAPSMIARSGGNSVRLFNAACALPNMPGDAQQPWRAAQAVVHGKQYTGCWIVLQRDVLIVYEDGDQGLVPVSDFKLDDGA